MIRLREVSVVRGPNRILEGLSMVAEPGRIFWVVGPNGAGKSSLLRVLAGLDAPASGTVSRALPAGERLLYFHSEMALPAAARVRDWDRLVRTLLPGRRAGSGSGVRPDVPARRRIAHLSTGERKRLLLDALLRQDGSMVLDEPLEHLSPDAKTALLERLAERARRHVVVLATNQRTEGAGRDGGLRLDVGIAEILAGAGS